MNEREFIDTIKLVVTNTAVESVANRMTDPPGRMPSDRLKQLTIWMKGLTEEDQQYVMAIIKDSVDEAVFGFLCVLDGVRAIGEAGEDGKLLLYYEKDGKRKLLNDFDNEFLHDIYNEI